MVKVRWGWDDGDAAVSASEIDDWEDDTDFYDGEKPSKGTFLFEVTRVKKELSKAGNPKLTVHMRLVGRTTKDKEYDGCPLTDFLPIMKSTVWRFAPFLRAIGSNGRALLSQCYIDSEGNVLKIGKINPIGKRIIVQVQLDENEEYLNVKRYLNRPDADDADDADDAADDADDADDGADDDADDADEVDDADDDAEQEEKPKAKKAKKAAKAKPKAKAKKRKSDDDDDDDDLPF